MPDWRLGVVADVAVPRGLVGGPFGSNLVSRDYVDAGVPVIRGQNLSSGRWVDLSNSVYVTHQKLEQDLGRNTACPGDLVFTQRGTLGQVAMVPDDAPTCVVSQSQMRLRVDSETADPLFVYYWATSGEFLRTLDDRAIVSGVPHINLGILGGMPMLVPPLDEQRRIASVLGALDDLIETNRRAIASSLELAVAAFGHLVLGDARSVPLEDVTTKIGSGATPRGGKDVYQDEGVAFIRSQNVYDGRFEFDGLARIADSAADALRGVTVNPGDVLINITGESVGRTARVPDRALPARVSQHVAIVRPDAAVLHTGYLLVALLSAPVQSYLHGLSTAGATRRALTKAHLESTTIPLPPLADQRRIASVLDTVEGLETEIADLARARDELLPLLMSGKVRVSDDLAVA